MYSYVQRTSSHPGGFRPDWRRLSQTLLISALLSIVAVIPVQGQMQYYAAPNGTSTGDGSIDRPWSLATALSKSTTVKPGDTIWLRGGTYGTGGGALFINKLNGSPSAPIIVRQYMGEHATVDGGIKVNGAYTWFWGLEITNSNPDRNVTTLDSQRNPGIALYGRGNKAINLIINNTGRAGIGFWSTATSGADSEVYGCILWGNGTYQSGTRRGDAIYANTVDPNPTLALISDTISFRNFNQGIKGWSEWASKYVNNFQLVNNVSFDNNWGYDLEMADKFRGMIGLKVINNFTYQPPSEKRNCTRFGTAGIAGGDAEVRGNYFVCGSTGLGSLYINGFSTLSLTGNTLISPSIFARWNPPKSPVSDVWATNQYFKGATSPFMRGSTYYKWDAWRALGYDADSSRSTAYPTDDGVFVLPNKYESGRAHVIVYNWRGDLSVPVDLSSVLASGDAYEVRDAQNYWGSPIVDGIYDGAPVSLSTVLTDVSPVPGETHFVNDHTNSGFNVYVVIKK